MKIVYVIGLSLLIASVPASGSWVGQAVAALGSFFKSTASAVRPLWDCAEFNRKADLFLGEKQLKGNFSERDEEGNVWSSVEEVLLCDTPRGSEYTQSVLVRSSNGLHDVKMTFVATRNGSHKKESYQT